MTDFDKELRSKLGQVASPSKAEPDYVQDSILVHQKYVNELEVDEAQL